MTHAAPPSRIAAAQHRATRRTTAMGYIQPRLQAVERWLDESNETTNFTYDLTPINRQHLAAFIAAIVSDASTRDAVHAIDELEHDDSLRAHIAQQTRQSRYATVADAHARYARRLGWYALARMLKPKLIVETGVDKGLGACVFAAALQRNHDAKQPGRYLGIDINPNAGWLLAPPYDAHARIITADSLTALRDIDHPIELFIHDSDHSAEHEAAEYDTIQHRLADNAVILSDNAHVTDVLFQFAQRTGRRFLYFHEQPADHWYPGAGIGAAF